MPYKRGDGTWVGQVRRGEKRIQKLFQTKGEARVWEAEVKRRPQLRIPLSSGPLLCEWATEYLRYVEIRFRVKTFKEKRSAFREFFKHVSPKLSVDQLSEGIVLSYLGGQCKDYSGNRANKHRKNFCAAWNWGTKYLGLPRVNPFQVDRFPQESRRRYVPPESDFWRVRKLAEEGQDQLMLLCYLHTAGRRAEIFNLRWEDVDFGRQEIRLGTRKRADGSLEYEWLPMTNTLYESLLVHRQLCTSQWVFPNPRTKKAFVERKRWMRGLCKRAKVKPFGLHAIRHLTASILAEAGEPLIKIQKILRHKQLRTTERYLHMLEDLRSSLKVFEKRGNVIFVGKKQVTKEKNNNNKSM